MRASDNNQSNEHLVWIVSYATIMLLILILIFGVFLHSKNDSRQKINESSFRASHHIEKCINYHIFNVQKVVGFDSPSGLLKIYVFVGQKKQHTEIIILKRKSVHIVKDNSNTLVFNNFNYNKKWILRVDFLIFFRGVYV